jgi:hypothetical protein
MEYLSSKDCLWFANQIGIVLEIIGALIIVISAFKTRAAIKNIPNSWGANLAEKLRDVISEQAYTELSGFGLLAVGLLLQFIGAFE